MNLEGLNPPQKEAVMHKDGPLLILAGAGSGKTRVLTYRVAYLIEQGVKPYNIMAITFTNKAAREMKERIDNIVGFGSDQVWCATFHSSCVRMLRRFADRIGYDSAFTIYDPDDCKSVMKAVCKDLDVDTKNFKEKMLLAAISDAKNKLIGPIGYSNRAAGYREQVISEVYTEYQSRLKKNNAMDFDDLIMLMVKLLREDPEVAQVYHDKFHYIMVDEYQDTNLAQFELVRLLAQGRENLCVVGDDDQSIYKFRGADIRNILEFDKHFPHAKVVKLEQNYRSSGNILAAANEVIANNEGRKAKRLWTEADAGAKITFKQFDSASEEATFIAYDIESKMRNGVNLGQPLEYNDFAVLYRTNAQSRLIEERFIYEGIPYKIVGGVNFYSRKEIKDILAYVKTIASGKDDVAVERIINVPKRGIGATSVNKCKAFATANNLDLYDAFKAADMVPGLGKASGKIKEFVDIIQKGRQIAALGGISAVIEEIIELTGYVAELELEHTDEAEGRIENINELISKAVIYEQEHENPEINGFLEEVALVADIDSLDENADYVVLMTLHGAKGLEFNRVYMSGMEDGLFPGAGALFDAGGADSEMEEERRLCYVGITRAKEYLTMTAARARMIRGETQFSNVSRFVKEIPPELVDGSVWDPKPRESEYSSVASPKEISKALRTVSTNYSSNQGTKISKSLPEYGVGDRVSHIKFKEGTVVAIEEGERDYEVTVEFDGAGKKVMLASFARLQIVRR